MKLNFTSLILVISLLPLSQKINTTEKIHPASSEVSSFAPNLASRFFDQKKEKATPDIDKLKQGDWYATAMKNMEEGEYHFNKVANSDRYSTPNRKNNLRFYYDESGFSVEPRTTKIPIGNYDRTTTPDKIKYKTLPDWKVAFQLDKKQISKGTWEINGNKAEYKTDHITVQYINNDEGMRQNFIIQKPLSKDKNIKLNFSVKTKLKQRFSSDRLQFVHDKSGEVLNYEQLKVWDANGKLLAAAFEKGKNNYSIHVNTTDATYPITIDPISTTASAILEGNQANAQMGYSVSSAGDVNGDGYSDVILGAPFFDNGQSDEGAAFIYQGSTTGINTATSAMVESNQTGANMGYSVASAGDVNGDGYSDLIVGAYAFDNGQINEGSAFVYHGSATGIDAAMVTAIESNQADAWLGYSVASAGDVNGDGYSDVIVGAYFYDNGQSDEGNAFIYHGSATGISPVAAARMESNQPGAQLGYSVASAGDINGDGYSDVIVGANEYGDDQTQEGAAFVYHGSATGISPTAVALIEGGQDFARMGNSLASAGDVNGDGYSDVIVGAYLYDNGQHNEGAAFVYHGSAIGINTTAAAMVESDRVNALIGSSVASAGDVNGDGYSDVIVGAYQFNNGQTDEGAAFIYHGSSTGINTTAATMLESNHAGAWMGYSVASAGDINGDGYSDVVIGAPYYDNGQPYEGGAFTHHGSAAGINTTAATMVESNKANAQMGWSVASAGDVNGDGYSDVIVGAYQYDNGQINEGVAFIYHGSAAGISTTATAILERNQAGAAMGFSVASAGDVNGDGYSDVIVGAYQYDNGQSFEGAAFIYHGSPTGINTTAAALIESNRENTLLGASVAGAGDVNGDGYSDVIVGVLQYENGEAYEGAAFIYHGSATGINTVAAAIVESNQVNAQMGAAVSGAGDVNGDGYSDVIVGVYRYENGEYSEGAAFVYHGSATGINITAAAIVESDQVNAQMGNSVSSAGDVNGDGYSDVIIGAIRYDNGQFDEGAAFIFHGSATGINSTAAALIESNQAFAGLGSSVSGAGDVNGDGYSDVIVGAFQYDNGQTDEGAAFVYHGSTTGISTTATALVESNQANALMGQSVAGAGDVNGDGYSDVIAGANQYDDGQTDEGATFIYFGNAATNGNRQNIKLYNVDLTTPISSSNFGLANFGAGLFAKSFLGRNKGKLVWETKVSYDPYSGTPITNSVVSTSQQGSYTDLILTGSELKNLIIKQSGMYTKIRARVKYDPATAITGQIYGPWRYVSSLTAGTTGGALPVDLISFKVAWQQQGKTAQIKFITENESEICCYDIEKSDNGFNFIKIGHLDARNAAERHTYNFIDSDATGKGQYYRLKTIHSSGTIDYSRIQFLQDKTSTEILVFPNPTTDVLELKLNNTYSKINVRIVNDNGQIVKQLTDVSTTAQTIKIPVHNLASGSYLLCLQTGMEQQVLQFVKD